MSAKKRAAFINAVAEKMSIPCPSCNSANEPDSKFCYVCGTQLEAPSPSADSSNLSLSKTNEAAFGSINSSLQVSAETPKGIFAEGLPEWNLEPPQVVVRRRRHV